MLTDIDISASAGTIEGPEPDASVLAVVCFIERHLSEFSNQYKDSPIKVEKGLTQMLVLLLNAHASRESRLFWFDKEYLEEPERGDSPAIDIGTITKLESGIAVGSKTYGKDESFFSLEAKRLCDLGKKRQKEYLIGRFENEKYVSTGGVERFKQGIHGRKLKYGAIIGYVQEHDSNHWHGILTAWIDELIAKRLFSPVHWTSNDKLKKVYIKTNTAKFTSVNSRQSDDIRLFHLWVSLISNAPQ